MGFEEKSTTCSTCGKLVSAGNDHCGYCGTLVSKSSTSPNTIELTGGATPAQHHPRYERKYSTSQRLTKLLTSPKDAMDDIGLAPDYSGVIVLFVIWTIFSIIGVMIMLPKLQFIGPYGPEITRMVMASTVGTLILVPFILVIRWLVKSYLIRHACDSKSWDFQTAASVTGYAYLPNIIFSFVWIIVIWLLMPSVVIDTTDLAQALIQMEIFDGQTMWLTVGVSMVLSIITLLWKSYLGSFGTYTGTHNNCERNFAFVAFAIIGLIGIVIDLASNFL